MKEFYCEIKWHIEDIQNIRPEWTDEQCHKWWQEHERVFRDILTQYGNECLECMIDE